MVHDDEFNMKFRNRVCLDLILGFLAVGLCCKPLPAVLVISTLACSDQSPLTPASLPQLDIFHPHNRHYAVRIFPRPLRRRLPPQ